MNSNHDMIALQQENARLQERITLLESMLNNVGACIFAKDSQGCYTFANQAVLEVFGLPQEQVIGKDDAHFFDLSRSAELKENDNIVLGGVHKLENEETNVIKATGETRVYKTVKQSLTDHKGHIIGICGISTDITAEKKLQKVVREQKQLLDTVLDNVDAYIYMKNSNREFLYVNSKTADLFGRSVEEIVGQTEMAILPPEIAEHFHESDKRVFETNHKHVINEEIQDESGATLHYLSVKVPLEREGELPALIGFSSDVTELYTLKEDFRKQANTVPLTQLFNRRYFFSQADNAFEKAKKKQHTLSLIAFDIDHFKYVNDEFGHPVGDLVLSGLAQKLQPLVRTDDVLARIGGEEFSLLLIDTPFEEASKIAERLRDTIATGNWVKNINITISLGIATLKVGDSSFDDIFKRADNALYRAKSQGRNCVCKEV